MSAKDAKAYAQNLFSDGLSKLQQSAAVYQQLAEQLPSDVSLRAESWRLQAHLNANWEYYSQVGQDKFIFETFFRSAKEGFFVDVGAYDGVTGSNTCFFERTLGWAGLCFEASPSQFPALQQRRRSPCINIAVGDHSGEEVFLDVVAGYTQMSGLLSDLNDPRLIRANPQHAEREVRVAVRPLSELLDEHGVTTVDYCSIDVEGAEMRVLKGIDFDRHRISVLSIENAHHYHPTSPSGAREFMEARGYRYVETIGYDEIFAL